MFLNCGQGQEVSGAPLVKFGIRPEAARAARFRPPCPAEDPLRQPPPGRLDERGNRGVGEGRHAAHFDLAEDVTVVRFVGRLAEEEVGVPDQG